MEKISRGEKGYREVYYDPMYNRDRLDKMRISHETLLEYGFTLIQKYPKMRQIVIDSYPYILIDEYQDTANIVVEIMNSIGQYVKEIRYDIIRLGKVQSLLYRLIKLYTEVREKKQALRDILPTDEYRNMSFTDLKKLIVLLQSLKGNTLDELMVDIFGKYKVSSDKTYKLIIEKIFDIDEISYEGTLKYFLHSLYDSYDEEMETKQIIGEILNLKIAEVLCWFHYVNRDENKEIYYHTFHSTKGLEYENVIIILGKDFGQDKGLFELFFKEYGEDISQDLPKYEKYERGRNILYVAVTRATKNRTCSIINQHWRA